MAKKITQIPNGFVVKINAIIPNANDCWLWKRLDKRGYGRYGHSGGYLAHRLSYAHFVGAVPEDKHVCHRCDIPACVNPSHLFLGSDLENIHDMKDKGRQRYIGPIKLSVEALLEIKSELKHLPKRRYGREPFYKSLANKHGVCWQYIRQLGMNKVERLMDECEA